MQFGFGTAGRPEKSHDQGEIAAQASDEKGARLVPAPDDLNAVQFEGHEGCPRGRVAGHEPPKVAQIADRA